MSSLHLFLIYDAVVPDIFVELKSLQILATSCASSKIIVSISFGRIPPPILISENNI